MFKKMLNGFIDNPLMTSIFTADLLILVFHKPPFIFALVMQLLLAFVSMYLGQKMAMFKE